MFDAPRIFHPADPDFPTSPVVQQLLRRRGLVMGDTGEVTVWARPALPATASTAPAAAPRKAAQ